MKRQPLFCSRVIPASILTLLLAACGGDDIFDDENETENPPETTAYNLSGSVSGLDGALTLSWLDTTTSLDSNGAFEVTDAIDPGEDVDLSLSGVPQQQNCSITSTSSIDNVQADVTGIAIECQAKPSLSVNVTNYFNGEVVEGAMVDADWETGGESYQASGETDANGVAILYSNQFSGRMSVTADAEGYGEQTAITTFEAESTEGTARVQLLPVNGTTTFTASEGGDLTVEGVDAVTVPASGFVDADGGIYTGEITAEITFVDPSSDPAVMPGEFERIDPETGETAPIESFGAINVTFADADGNDLDLAEGETATVRIPVAESANNPPATIPLFYFDEELGYWVEEGEATLTTNNGTSVYEGTVSHFTTWNADRVYETVYINGCVIDGNDDPIVGASVRTRGNSYIGTASARTDDNGQFSVAARMESSLYISAVSGGQSRTVTVSTNAQDMTLENCLATDEASTSISLSWGENPDDLDSHLTGPSNAEGSEFFHVYYSNEDVNLGDAYIYLDVDDTDSFGPEVISMSSFPFPGTYRYGVHRYGGSGTIASSPARVELAIDGDITVYSPPGGEATDCWAVVNIVVGEDESITVNPVNEWNDAYCDEWQEQAITSEKTGVLKSAPFSRAVERKYYAE